MAGRRRRSRTGSTSGARPIVVPTAVIVETGTHAELLTHGGLYRRLHEMQFFSEADERSAVPPGRQTP
jgi:hypothetical protein